MTRAAHTFPPVADEALNITDHWRAATDPENERGEYAEALFEVSFEPCSVRRDLGHGRFRETPYLRDVHRLIGVTIEDGDEIRFLDRAECLSRLGGELVRKVEVEADEADE